MISINNNNYRNTLKVLTPNLRRVGGVSSKCTGRKVLRVAWGDAPALPGTHTGGGGGGGGAPGLRATLGAGGGDGAPGLQTAAN